MLHLVNGKLLGQIKLFGFLQVRLADYHFSIEVEMKQQLGVFNTKTENRA